MNSDRWIQTLGSLFASRGEDADDILEMKDLLTLLLPSILENDPMMGSVLSGGTAYYIRLVNHIIENDPCTVDLVEQVTQRLRTKYKPWDEYQLEMTQIPVERQGHVLTGAEDDVCCICHESMKTWRKVWRLKAVSGDPTECGHILHYGCILRLKPDEGGNFHCPLCRASLGPHVKTWFDMTSRIPRF